MSRIAAVLSGEAAAGAVAVRAGRGAGQRLSTGGPRPMAGRGGEERAVPADGHFGFQHHAVQPDSARAEIRPRAGVAHHHHCAHAPLPVRAGGRSRADAPGARQPHVHARAAVSLAHAGHGGRAIVRPRLGTGRTHLRRHVRARLEMNAAIEITNLKYRYHDGTEALRGVSFRVAPGECVALARPERLRQIHAAAALERHSAGKIVRRRRGENSGRTGRAGKS